MHMIRDENLDCGFGVQILLDFLRQDPSVVASYYFGAAICFRGDGFASALTWTFRVPCIGEFDRATGAGPSRLRDRVAFEESGFLLLWQVVYSVELSGVSYEYSVHFFIFHSFFSEDWGETNIAGGEYSKRTQLA